MTNIRLFHVDAFASAVFSGNPAAVCPLDVWLDEAAMQSIAGENNLSETAFVVRERDGWKIRWFTPTCEVDLCGHATLASAWVVFNRLDPGSSSVTFSSRSGPLTVTREGDFLALDFPARPPAPCATPPGLLEGLGRAPREVQRARDLMAVYEREEDVRALTPDFARLATLDSVGVIVTAPGRDVDFVSRFFAPGHGVLEDPVTGSSHCTLIPWWAKRLGKTELRARQVSRRGGELTCALRGDRVKIAGKVAPYLEGMIAL
ncbi:MAG: PhzF family phenazine biosynthesis protein [Planctomycetes bacterium]|nr:PhzF family phenazine biosynthesis protein [Planctomycetota bacterium]